MFFSLPPAVSFTHKLNCIFSSRTIFFWLGFLYQNKDLEFHNGGVMQPAALNAFNKALELSVDRPEVTVRVNQQKGACVPIYLSPFCVLFTFEFLEAEVFSI